MTPDEIISKWIGIGLFDDEPCVTQAEANILAGLKADIEQAVNAAVEEEREACAQILDRANWSSVQELAAKIRARSNASGGTE